MKESVLRIGDVARRIGVHPEAIRYYERRGLLPRPKRTPNGYRVYTLEHLERVEFIKKAQTFGFSLEEIGDLLELRYGGASPCQHVRDLLSEKLQAVDRQIARLRAFRSELAQSLRACESSLKRHARARDACPVLERLAARRAERE